MSWKCHNWLMFWEGENEINKFVKRRSKDTPELQIDTFYRYILFVL